MLPRLPWLLWVPGLPRLAWLSRLPWLTCFFTPNQKKRGRADLAPGIDNVACIWPFSTAAVAAVLGRTISTYKRAGGPGALGLTLARPFIVSASGGESWLPKSNLFRVKCLVFFRITFWIDFDLILEVILGDMFH